ncbi:hypothetical protein EV424DRAFT_1571449 [Suillus variegatus]|nr:hypothetical protein EV424DRAFT_1571449 [Suillus variegatus]
MQQFQEISQANEAALSALNATHDQYKAEIEAQISKNELEYKVLQDKLRSVEDDVQQSADKFSELQCTFELERLVWTNDKKTLEDTIVDLSTSEKTSETDRTTRESEVRQQEERALLAASEGSWKQQKEVLDQEIADLNARDLSAQNALLHQHLETVSTRIRQAADSSATDGTSDDADISDDVDTKVLELRSVVAYWRKEKEMVDLQLGLSRQENVRLTAHIEHLTQSLRETGATLAEESNATFRAGCETYAKRSHELDAKLQALSAELKPVKDQARELGARDAQITRLEGESRRWQEHNAQLLSKLSRLEANFRNHKDSNTKNADKFKSSLGLLNSEKSQLSATINELEGKIKILTAKRDALHTTSASDALQQLNSQLETLRQEKVALEQALANERAVKSQASAEGSSDHATLVASLREERHRLLAEKKALRKAGSSTLTFDTARSWESEKLELIKARDEALAHASVVRRATEGLVRGDKDLLDILGYRQKLQEVDKAILANAEFLKLIVANPEIFGHDLDSPKDADEDKAGCRTLHEHSHSFQHQRKYKPTGFDMDKLRSTLKQFVRDWSQKGKEERKTCYMPMKDALVAHFSDKPSPELSGLQEATAGAGSNQESQ